MRMRPRLEWLTERERLVLIDMMHGKNAEQIASDQIMAVCTVRTHIRSILSKLGVKSQLAAVAYANRQLWPTEEDHTEALMRTVRRTA